MAARLRQLDQDGWWSYAADELRHADVVVHDADADEIRRLLMIYQLNTLSLNYVLNRYVPPLYTGKLMVVHAEKMYPQPGDQAQVWQQLTTEPIAIQVVPGDHGTIFHQPNVEVLARTLFGGLADAPGEAAPA